MAGNLVADGSNTPSVTFDPTAGDEWKLFTDGSVGSFSVQKNVSGGGYDTMLYMEGDNTAHEFRVVGPPGGEQFTVNLAGTTVKLTETANSAAIWLTASAIELKTRRSWPPRVSPRRTPTTRSSGTRSPGPLGPPRPS